MAIASTFGVVAVTPVPANNVGPFYVAPDKAAMRVLVRNLGGSALFLAFASSDLNGLQVTSTRFELPAAMDAVFVLQPRQSLFAVSVGAGERLCYAASEALPMSTQGV